MIKKLLFAASLFIGASFTVNSQIVINEIMYNIPGSGENEEYVELFNAGSSVTNISGYTLADNGGNITFTGTLMPAGAYYVVAKDSATFRDAYGFDADFIWTGNLSNSGEYITLKDGSSVLVDSVSYDDAAPWPIEADGDGHALQLCSPTTDNNDGVNWGINFDSVGVNGTTGIDILYGTPGMANVCVTPPAVVYVSRTIDEINNADPITGIGDSVGLNVELGGIVHCGNFRSPGYDFPFANSNGEGIRVFSFVDVDSYNVGVGDSIVIKGEVVQYNGLLQLSPDSIMLISAANPLLTATVVTTLDESTENKYVELQNVHIVDTAAWTNSGSGFNVEVTTGGADTLLVRIDADVNIFGTPVPTGTFNISGWGGQFDNSNPFTEGYQLLPCSLNDIVTQTTGISSIDENSVMLYPNPANEVFTVKGTESFSSITILNSLGAVVNTINNVNTDNFNVNTNDLKAGNYIVVIETNESIITKQLVLIK